MANIGKVGARVALMGTLLWVGVATNTPGAGACTSASQCLSGFCVDSVCCNTACTGSMEKCNLPGHLGTCTIAGVVKCQEAKFKAQAKLQQCLGKNSAKVLGGATDASAACRTAFSDALSKADATAAKKSATCRYLDNGDGTVSDLNTGLQWEKKDNLDSVVNDADPHDADNSYSWSSSGAAADGTAYTDFLANVNNGVSTNGGASTPITGCFAGHCDWRLPSIVELRDIVDLSAAGCGSGSACIDAAFGPTQALGYWSATTAAGFVDFAWVVDFGGLAGVFYSDKTSTFWVRAVRGGL